MRAPTPAGVLQREAADQQRARLFRHRLVDRVLPEQRVVREVHLRHQPLRERPAEEREVDVRGPPGVGVVPPRVRAGLDRRERVAAVRVGQRAPDPDEAGVERSRPLVAEVAVAARGVGLPDLQQRVRHRPAAAVADLPEHDDPLPDRLHCGLSGEVCVAVGHPAVAEQRAGDLGQPLRQVHQGQARRAGGGRPVAGRAQLRVHAGGDGRVVRQQQPVGHRAGGHALLLGWGRATGRLTGVTGSTPAQGRSRAARGPRSPGGTVRDRERPGRPAEEGTCASWS